MTQGVITSVLAGAADVELEDWGPLEEATAHPDGDAWTRDVGRRREVRRYLAVHTRAVVLGAGRERGHLLLSGRMTVTPDGGEPTDVGAGDIAVFPDRLERYLGHPRDGSEGLFDLLTEWCVL